MTNKSGDVFFGFYTYPSFWSEKIPDIKNKPEDFTNLMSEEVYVFNSPDFIIKICRDGLILFQNQDIIKTVNAAKSDAFSQDFNKTEKEITKNINYLNCIYVLLNSNIIKAHGPSLDVSEITKQEIIQFSNSGHSIPKPNASSILIEGRYLFFYNPSIPLIFDSRISLRHYIPTKDVFDKLIQDFKKVFDSELNSQIIARISESINQYKVANYSTSLILLWLDIERYVLRLWNNTLISKNKLFSDSTERIDSNRREILAGKHSLFTAFIVSNVLELFDIIDYDLYKAINTTRVKRNEIAHGDDKKISADDCIIAFDIIKKIVKYELKIDLEIDLSRSISL